MHLIGCIIDKPNCTPDRENMKKFLINQVSNIYLILLFIIIYLILKVILGTWN